MDPQGVQEFAGEFWAAHQDDIRQRGVLRIAPGVAPRVEVDGALWSPTEEVSRRPLPNGGMAITSHFSEEKLTAPVTIYGLDNHGTPLTLLEARTAHWGSDGHHLQGIRAIIGSHVLSRDHQFTGFRLRLWPLDAWRPLLQDATWPTEVRLAGDGVLAIDDLPRSSGASESALWLTIQELEPCSLIDLERRFLRPLITLFTLATDTPCELRAHQVQESPDRPWWDVYSSAIHAENNKLLQWEQPRWLLWPTHLSLRSLCTWLDRVEKLGPLPPVVADLAHAKTISVETQVLLLCTIAEGLHRRLYPDEVRFDEDTADSIKDAAVEAVRSLHPDAASTVRGFLSHIEEVGYAKRLTMLAKAAESAAPGITGRTSKWKELVYGARNGFAHRPVGVNFLGDKDIDRYMTIILSLRWVLTMVLLLQADIDPAALAERTADHEAYKRFLADVRRWQPGIYSTSP